MREHVEGAFAKLHFLQRDDVGVELAHDRFDALGMEQPVPSDSDVDVFVDPDSDERFGFLAFMDAYGTIRKAIGGNAEVGYSTRAGLSRYIRTNVQREAIRIF